MYSNAYLMVKSQRMESYLINRSN